MAPAVPLLTATMPPVVTNEVHALSEKKPYSTLPVAGTAVPPSCAVTVTGVLTGTEIEVPCAPPPEAAAAIVGVGGGRTVTVD